MADLLVPGQAGRAGATCADEREGDPGSRAPAGDGRPDRLDGAGELVTRDVRQPDVRVVANPAVPVRAAQPGRLDPNDCAVDRGRRIRHLVDPDRPAELRVLDSPHHVQPPRRQVVASAQSSSGGSPQQAAILAAWVARYRSPPVTRMCRSSRSLMESAPSKIDNSGRGASAVRRSTITRSRSSREGKWLRSVPGATSARKATSRIVVPEIPSSVYSAIAASTIRARVASIRAARSPMR